MKHDTSFVVDPRILPLIHRFHMYVINFYWFCEDEASPSNVSTIQTLTVSLIKDCMAQTNGGSLYKAFLPVLSLVFVSCSLAMADLLCQTPKSKLRGKKRESWCCKENTPQQQKSSGLPKYLFLLLIVETFQVMIVSLMKTMAKSQMITVALNQVIDGQILRFAVLKPRCFRSET